MVLTIDDINNISEDTQFTREEIDREVIDKLFLIKQNNADGNCLFESVSQCLHNNMSKSSKYRKLVCDFYKTFENRNIYPAGSFEETIFLALLVFNNDNNDQTDHSIKICQNKIYVNTADIHILANKLKINIFIFFVKENIRIIPYLVPNSSTNIYLKYNGINHYEALLPISPPSPSKKTPSPTIITPEPRIIQTSPGQKTTSQNIITPEPRIIQANPGKKTPELSKKKNNTRRRKKLPTTINTNSPTPIKNSPTKINTNSPTPIKNSPTPNNNIILRGTQVNDELYLNKDFQMNNYRGTIIKNPNSKNIQLPYLLKFNSNNHKDLPVNNAIIGMNIDTGKLKLL